MEGNPTKKQYKSTIVFFSIDALGHIHPILPVVNELNKRGHKAIVVTTRPMSMAKEFRARGFDFQSCIEPIETTNQNGKKTKNNEELLQEIMKPLIQFFRTGLPDSYEATYKLEGACGKHLIDMIDNHDAVEAKLKSLKPDLIVFDHIIGVPCATTVAKKWARVYSGYPIAIYSCVNDRCVAGQGLSITEMTEDMKKFEHFCKGPIREKLRRFFLEKRCPDWPYQLDLSPHSPYLNMCFSVKELDLSRYFDPLPKGWYTFEHSIDQNLEEVEEFTMPKELDGREGKLIYFSMGTLVSNDYETINRLLDIMSKSPNKFIVSMGPMHKQVKLYSNMWGEKFLDQRAILPKVDLFITHGGHNSIIEAFYYGVPGLIVLPVFADQFDCAQQVTESGLGIRLNPFKCTEEELLSAINSRLSDAEVAKRMASIGNRMRSTKEHLKMAELLEGVLDQ